MRRTAVAIAGLLLLSASPHAQAARQAPVPAPTVNVAITFQGQILTKTAVDAEWSYDDRGRVSQLDVDTVNPLGTVVTVDALWTSKEFLALRQFPQFTLKAKTFHSGSPSSSMPSSFTYGYRVRDAGKAWGAWRDTIVNAEAGNPGTSYTLDDQPFSTPGIPPKGKKIQLQWRLHIESADPSRDTHQWNLVTNQP